MKILSRLLKRKSAGSVTSLLRLFEGVIPAKGESSRLRLYRDMPYLRSALSKIAFSIREVEWYTAINGERVDDHPLTQLINAGNAQLDRETIFQLLQLWLDLKGNAFLLKILNGAGKPVELWPVSPANVQLPQQGQEKFKVTFGNQILKPTDPAEIIWIKDVNPEDPYGVGIGIVESLHDELETDAYISEHVKSWFHNRAIPPVLIGVEEGSTEDIQAAKELWNAEHQGVGRAHKTHWYKGKITVKELAQKFADMKLIDLRKLERDVVLQTLGISPEILGIVEHSNRATIEAASYIFAKYVLVPRLELFRGALQRQLAVDFGPGVTIHYESPVQEDKEFKLKVASRVPQFLTQNEWREMMGLPEIDPLPIIAPITLTATKSVTKRLTEAEIDSLVQRLSYEALWQRFRPAHEEQMLAWGSRALNDLRADRTFSLQRDRLRTHLAEKELKIKEINETTKARLKQTLLEGVKLGEGIDAIVERIQIQKGQAITHAATIARTEVLSSSNLCTFEAQLQSGVINRREWVTAIDGREREEHKLMDAQQRSITVPFTAPEGETAMYPGDFGVAHLDINCRCTTRAVIGDPKMVKISKADYWRKYDQDLRPWEDEIEVVFEEGFSEQFEIFETELIALAALP